jgi:hypothetical protein
LIFADDLLRLTEKVLRSAVPGIVAILVAGTWQRWGWAIALSIGLGLGLLLGIFELLENWRKEWRAATQK